MAITPKYRTKVELIEKLNEIETLVGAAHCWTKGANARDEHDLAIAPKSRRAVCFCLAGALMRVCTIWRQREILAKLILAEINIHSRTDYAVIEAWNDQRGRTQTQVVNMVRRTRERLAATA